MSRKHITLSRYLGEEEPTPFWLEAIVWTGWLALFIGAGLLTVVFTDWWVGK